MTSLKLSLLIELGEFIAAIVDAEIKFNYIDKN